MLQRLFSFVIFLFISSVKICSQVAPFKKIDPRFELEKISLKGTADIGSLNDIYEDREGYIWLSGNKGLHLFDGQHLITYNSTSLPYRIRTDSGSNNYSRLIPCSGGQIVVEEGNEKLFRWDPLRRTVTGMYSYRQSEEDKFIVPGSWEGNELTFLKYIHTDNTLSVCLKKGNEPEQTLFSTPVVQNNQIVYKVVNREHWLLYGDSIYQIAPDGKTVNRFTLPGNEKGIKNIEVFGKDIYFFSNEQQAVYKYNPGTAKPELFLKTPPLLSGRLQTFLIDKNLIYVGSNLNLLIIDKQEGTVQDLSAQFTELAKKSSATSLSEPLGKMIRLDNGLILLLTETSIYRVHKLPASVSQFEEKLVQDNPVVPVVSYRGLTEDSRHNLYASYYTGFARKTPGATGFRAMPVNQYMRGGMVSTFSMASWRNFLIWNNVMLDPESGRFRYLFDSVFSGHCTLCLQHDSLWMFKWGTRTIHCYDLIRNKLSGYPFNISIPNTINLNGIVDINDIVPAKDGGSLWMSSHDFGICLISKKGELLKDYRAALPWLQDNYITDLELQGDLLWFGCNGGLGLLNTVTGEAQVYKNPVMLNGEFRNRMVYSIQPDSAGNLYLGTSYGLVFFNTKSRLFYNLPEGHPLSAREYNRGSVFRSADGRFYFGTTDGLFSFLPEDLEFIKSNGAVRPVKLYSISYFDRQENHLRYLSENLDSLRELSFSPSDNNIIFRFSVPSTDADIYYSFRIRGLDENWSEYKPENTVQLNGLSPGKYVLEVKASTGLSDVNAAYYSLTLVMKQIWYKQTWFIVLIILLATGLLSALLRNRFNRRVKRQKDLADLRTRISSDLHDDVGTILSGLAMQSQMLAYTAPAEQKESLNEISSMSRDAMERMRDTVWAMDSRKDRYENLIDRMRAFAEKNLAAANMTHEFVISDIDTKRFINPEKRQAIYLIFKEAITNIVKHSDGHHVLIRLAHERNNLQLTVHDNGSEKPVTGSDGLGISNMKMRAEKIGGTIRFSYENGFRMELIA